MANEQQPRAGEVWGDPERPETWRFLERIEALNWTFSNGFGSRRSEPNLDKHVRIHPPAEPRPWTAEDVSAEQVKAVESAIADRICGSQVNQAMAARVTIAAAANVMSVPKPQPVAVDVERLAVAIIGAVNRNRDEDGDCPRFPAVLRDTLRRELSQPTAERPESEA